MRFLSAIVNDMRFQAKYGFYLIYALISALYIAALLFCPLAYRKMAASVIILTDPAMLGVFFIGGIWLLEKREGLHGFWLISPLRPMEYILPKAISLGIISTLAAGLIATLGLQGAVRYPLLFAGVFFGSMVFTIIGLLLATYARSVNQYMVIVTPPIVLLTVPAVLAAFGISCPFFEVLPCTAMWRLIAVSLDIDATSTLRLCAVLALWLGAVLYMANKRIPAAMQISGGLL